MSGYLLIESRDPFTSPAVAGHVELAAGLRHGGSEVAIYLVQDGVLACRAGADGDTLHAALAAGVEVLADDWSLRERGIRDADLARGIRPASVDLVIERLAGDWKAIFL